MELKTARETTAKAVSTARASWAMAPMHVRAMAGPYVDPLMAAIVAMEAERAAGHEIAVEHARELLEATAGAPREQRHMVERAAQPYGVFRT